MKTFQAISFHHIYGDFNKEVDQLSKQALQEHEGKITYYQWEPRGAGPLKPLTMF
jgi:hypothetical protein